MAQDYTTLAALKLMLKHQVADQDPVLASAITAASRGIERKTGRRFWADASLTARSLGLAGRVASGARGALLLVPDIASVSGLLVEVGDGSTWAARTDYHLWPDHALVDGWPVTGLMLPTGSWGPSTARVRVTARWGWPQIPDEISYACLLQAARLYRRKDSPEGVAGSPEWGLVRLPRLDPDVAALVDPFVLPGIA